MSQFQLSVFVDAVVVVVVAVVAGFPAAVTDGDINFEHQIQENARPK